MDDDYYSTDTNPRYAVYHDPEGASSLAQVQEWAEEHSRGLGCYCPVCDKIVKIRRYRVYLANVCFLVTLRELQRDPEWEASFGFVRINGPRKLPGLGMSNGYANLKFFGLLEHLGRENDGDTRGFWRVSLFGRRFLDRRETIPRYVWVYNNKILAASRENVMVDECRKGVWGRSHLSARLDVVPEELLRHDWNPKWMVARP